MPNGTDFQAAIQFNLVACPGLHEVSVIILASSLSQSVRSKPKIPFERYSPSPRYLLKSRRYVLDFPVRFVACENIFHYYNKDVAGDLLCLENMYCGGVGTFSYHVVFANCSRTSTPSPEVCEGQISPRYSEGTGLQTSWCLAHCCL